MSHLILFPPPKRRAALSPLLNNLLAYWKLEEASGTRADASGGGNTLTDNNTVAQNTGIIANAAEFVAINSESLSVAAFSPISSLTLSAWIYPADVVGLKAIVGKLDFGGTNSNEWGIYMNGAVLREIIDDGVNGKNASGGGTLLATTWQHAMLTYEVGGAIALYLNNSSVASSTYAGGAMTNTDAFRIGSTTTPLFFFGGRVDCVGLWSRVLDATERATLYGAGAPTEYPWS